MSTESTTNHDKTPFGLRLEKQFYERARRVHTAHLVRREDMAAFIRAELAAGRGVPSWAELAAKYERSERIIKEDLRVLGYGRFGMLEKRNEAIIAGALAYFAEHGRAPNYADFCVQYGVGIAALRGIFTRAGIGRDRLAKERRAQVKAYVQQYHAEHGQLPTIADTAAALHLDVNLVIRDFFVLRFRDTFTLPIDLDAPYAAPFGDMRSYLRWRLARVAVGDTFKLYGIVFKRVDSLRFHLRYGLRGAVALGRTFEQVLRRVFACLDHKLWARYAPTLRRMVKAQSPALRVLASVGGAA